MAVQIGPLTLKSPFLLAPLAGVTDRPFRDICAKMGAGLTTTEMVSAKGLSYNSANTRLLLERSENDTVTAVQLFGREPDIMAGMAMKLEEEGFSSIDINMGCPAPKIVKNGEGSALMQEPDTVYSIVSAIVQSVRIPVTVKMRKGFKADNPNAVEIAKIAEAAGAVAVTVHGRTRDEYYSGRADWNSIRLVKEAVSIPVIGNGDVASIVNAKEMMAATGCDAVAIGRAAMGNPWIFDVQKTRVDATEVADMIRCHARQLVEYKGSYTGIREMRKHACWYMKGFTGAAKVRTRIQGIESEKELATVIEDWLEINEKGSAPCEDS